MANVAQKTPVHWEVFFEGMPDWAIPLIKVVPEFNTSDEYAEKWDDLTLEYSFRYLWEKVDDKNYKLYIRLSGELEDEDETVLPLFVNLSLWIINTNYMDSIQHSRGY
jgi:hypothetical protein